jgi:hypothetical protein
LPQYLGGKAGKQGKAYLARLIRQHPSPYNATAQHADGTCIFRLREPYTYYVLRHEHLSMRQHMLA